MKTKFSQKLLNAIPKLLVFIGIGIALSSKFFSDDVKVIIARGALLLISIYLVSNSQTLKYREGNGSAFIPLSILLFPNFLPLVIFSLFGFNIISFNFSISIITGCYILIDYYLLVYRSSNKKTYKASVFLMLCFYWMTVSIVYPTVAYLVFYSEGLLAEPIKRCLINMSKMQAITAGVCFILSLFSINFYLVYPKKPSFFSLEFPASSGNPFFDLGIRLRKLFEYLIKLIQAQLKYLQNICKLYLRSIFRLMLATFKRTGLFPIYIICFIIGLIIIPTGDDLKRYIADSDYLKLLFLLIEAIVLGILVISLRAVIIGNFALTNNDEEPNELMIFNDSINIHGFWKFLKLGIYVISTGFVLWLVNEGNQKLPSFKAPWVSLVLFLVYVIMFSIAYFLSYKPRNNQVENSETFTFWDWKEKQSTRYYRISVIMVVAWFVISNFNFAMHTFNLVDDFNQQVFIADSLKKDSVLKDSMEKANERKLYLDSVRQVMFEKRRSDSLASAKHKTDSLLLVKRKIDSLLLVKRKIDSLRRDSLVRDSIFKARRRKMRRRRIYYPYPTY